MKLKEQKLSGWRIIELLWPLNDMFRARLHEIRGLPYRAEFEAEADAAIDALETSPNAKSWSTLSPGAWRVLLERHQQVLTAAAMMEATGEGQDTITIPAGLDEDHQRAALMLLWLRGMKLPFPVNDRAQLELPPRGAPAPWRPH
jgi:hypothetical protein